MELDDAVADADGVATCEERVLDPLPLPEAEVAVADGNVALLAGAPIAPSEAARLEMAGPGKVYLAPESKTCESAVSRGD